MKPEWETEIECRRSSCCRKKRKNLKHTKPTTDYIIDLEIDLWISLYFTSWSAGDEARCVYYYHYHDCRVCQLQSNHLQSSDFDALSFSDKVTFLPARVIVERRRAQHATRRVQSPVDLSAIGLWWPCWTLGTSSYTS